MVYDRGGDERARDWKRVYVLGQCRPVTRVKSDARPKMAKRWM